jgi:hypothetical protein
MLICPENWGKARRSASQVPVNPGNNPENIENLQEISKNLQPSNPSETETHVDRTLDGRPEEAQEVLGNPENL